MPQNRPRLEVQMHAWPPPRVNYFRSGDPLGDTCALKSQKTRSGLNFYEKSFQNRPF